jgi:hypothetical protein
MDKTKRLPSPKKKCLICGKEFHTRGYETHLRMAHGQSEKIAKASMSGLSENTLHRPKRKSVKTAEYTIKDMIIMFGIAWVLHEIAKHTERKQKFQSEGYKLTSNLRLK